MVIKLCAQIYGHPDNAQMNGSQKVWDPLDGSTFNGWGGRGGDMMDKEHA
jgi:hypothetical protein